MVTAGSLFSVEMMQWVRANYGDQAAGRLQAWQELIARQQAMSESEKLDRVNRFFNRLHYRSDLSIWGRSDYWATPLEALGKGEADCEDYSIAKYFTLREMGVAEERMRIMYVKALDLDQAHMVLAYYADEGGVPLLLDNLKADIVPADKRRDLEPVYSFNGEGLWLAKQRGNGERLGSSSRLSLWREMRQRMSMQVGG
ncbi:MAG: transglutaminase-like cysteine peptidase [Sedimenticola sp.]|nr:transglutaminase-like cysteine peptidase [Sedimenticola sp.]